MNNHELLDLIGDVNEDYVLQAGQNVARPRFAWKTFAACAACAALVLGAYSISAPRSAGGMADSAAPAAPELHAYTVVEGGGMATLDDAKAPAGGESDPNAAPGGAYVRGGKGETGIDGAKYSAPAQDAPVDEAAAGQYDKLLKGLGGVDGLEPAAYPDWFAGAWIDHGGGPDDPACLAVAIVDGFCTPEREAEITGWCGDGVVFRDAKYSHGFLDSLMEPVTDLLDGTGLSCGIGVDVAANCLGVDLYSDGAVIPDSILAELARLDPAGDAIRVRLFTGRVDPLTDEIMKCPPEPVEPEARATPAVAADGEPAHYDLLPIDE